MPGFSLALRARAAGTITVSNTIRKRGSRGTCALRVIESPEKEKSGVTPKENYTSGIKKKTPRARAAASGAFRSLREV